MNATTTSTKRNWTIGLSVLVLASISLWVFLRQSPVKPTGQTDTVILRDVLLLSQTQISSFDPLDAFHEGHIQIVKQIYETLTDIDERGECVPLLAAKWETTDNKLWRFHLKTNVVFAGAACFVSKTERHLEAADVVYSFQRLLGPDSKSLGVAYFSDLAGLEAFRAGKEQTLRGVRAVGNDIVEFELTRPDAGFFRVLSVPYASIVKRKAVTHFGGDFKLKPVGTGPFVLARYEPDQEVLLRRNPDFRTGPAEPPSATVEEVRIRLTRDENAAFAAFASGTSDFLVLDFAGLTRIRRESNLPAFELISRPTAKLQFCLFNLKTVANADIRRAIFAAVNRRKLQELIGESGTVADSVFPKAIFPELAAPHPAFRDPTPQMASAKLPSDLRLVCFNDTLSRAVASRLADDFRAHGCNLRIEAATFPVLVERLTRGEYDLIQIYWGPLYAEPAHYLGPFLTSQFPPKGNNFNQYSNASFDARVASAKAAMDPAARQKLFLEAQDILLEDMPLLPLYFENLTRASNKKFALPTHPLLYRRYNLARPQ